MNEGGWGYGCLGLAILGFLALMGLHPGLVLAILAFALLVGIAFAGGRPRSREEVVGRHSKGPKAREAAPRTRASSEARSGWEARGPLLTLRVGHGEEVESPWNRGSRVDPDALWVPHGKPVEIAGYEVPGGLLYVGRKLVSANGWSTEPALVNPSLAVDRAHPDGDGANLHYWPSYRELPAASRAAYLQWLASGRRDPDVPIGYVFLFFYGLERRALVDVEDSPAARQEVEAIVAEVERLLSLYGTHHSFSGYASSFLHYLRLSRSTEPALVPPDPFPPPSPVLFDQRTWEIPGEVRFRLGQLLAAGRPIPAEWALAWYWTAPNTSLRTPAVRCAELFRRRFRERYGERFGEGLKVRPNKSRLKVEYRAASGGIHRTFSLDLDLPDVARLEAPLRKIGEVVDATTDDLDAYSRWLGRNDGQESSLPAVALLPAKLLEAVDSPPLDSFRAWLGEWAPAAGRTVLDAGDLLRQWPCTRDDRMNRKEATAVAHLLEKLGYGMEPDVRFGGPPPREGGKVVFFPLPPDSPAAPSREYSGAALLLHLSAVVAAADGEISPAEEQHLETHLEASPRLEEGERARLAAHLAWLLADPPGFAGLKKRLNSLRREQKRTLADFIVAVAGADGRIDAEEVKILGRIYGLLGLGSETVFSDLHALSAAGGPADGPVTVREGQPAQPGFALPPEPPSGTASGGADGGFRLDMERVRALRRESEETSRLLADVFRERDQPERNPVPAPSAEPDSGAEDEVPRIAGLDCIHSRLLHTLAASPAWSRPDFDSLAEGMGLLPAGALENLNEAAFERCDTPLLEGDDPLEIDSEVLQEMLS